MEVVEPVKVYKVWGVDSCYCPRCKKPADFVRVGKFGALCICPCWGVDRDK